MPDEIYYNPGEVTEEHGVLCMVHPTEADPEPGYRLYGSWHADIASALGELEDARKNPRFCYAALYTRKAWLESRTGNEVTRPMP